MCANARSRSIRALGAERPLLFRGKLSRDGHLRGRGVACLLRLAHLARAGVQRAAAAGGVLLASGWLFA